MAASTSLHSLDVVFAVNDNLEIFKLNYKRDIFCYTKFNIKLGLLNHQKACVAARLPRHVSAQK